VPMGSAAQKASINATHLWGQGARLTRAKII